MWRGEIAGFTGSGDADHRSCGIGEPVELIIESIPDHRVISSPAMGLSVGQHQHFPSQVATVTEQFDGVPNRGGQVGDITWRRQATESRANDVVVDGWLVDDAADTSSGFYQCDAVAWPEIFEHAVRELDGGGSGRLVSGLPAHATGTVDHDHHIAS